MTTTTLHSELTHHAIMFANRIGIDIKYEVPLVSMTNEEALRQQPGVTLSTDPFRLERDGQQLYYPDKTWAHVLHNAATAIENPDIRGYFIKAHPAFGNEPLRAGAYGEYFHTQEENPKRYDLDVKNAFFSNRIGKPESLFFQGIFNKVPHTDVFTIEKQKLEHNGKIYTCLSCEPNQEIVDQESAIFLQFEKPENLDVADIKAAYPEHLVVEQEKLVTITNWAYAALLPPGPSLLTTRSLSLFRIEAETLEVVERPLMNEPLKLVPPPQGASQPEEGIPPIITHFIENPSFPGIVTLARQSEVRAFLTTPKWHSIQQRFPGSRRLGNMAILDGVSGTLPDVIATVASKLNTGAGGAVLFLCSRIGHVTPDAEHPDLVTIQRVAKNQK